MRAETVGALVRRARSVPGALVLLVALVILPAGAPGQQLPEASASTLALSGAHTATVRGFGAMGVNPAGLGEPASGFTLALVPVRARAASGPVGLSDLSDYQDRVVPRAVKEEWLSAVEGAGGQSTLGGFDLSGFALSWGRVGFQLSTTSSARLHLSPGATEALLFGNAGRTGAPADLDLSGVDAEAFTATTGAAGVAFSVGEAVVGVTGKYTVGHALAVARASGGSVSSDPLRVTLETPVVLPCGDEAPGGCVRRSGNAGSGFGVDLGVRTEVEGVRVGAAVLDVLNTFSWNPEALAYRPGIAVVENGVMESDFEEAGYAEAPAAVHDVVDDATFGPSLRLGAAVDPAPDLTVSADVHHRLREGGLSPEPRSRLAAGVEWRGVRWLHLRGGAGLVSGGTELGAGASLVLGPVSLSLAGAVRGHEGSGRTTLGQATLSYGGR